MILPVGTRVVAKGPIAGTLHACPAGTPGVVVATPADASHRQRVRLG